jgi:ribosomal-protein-alanine N-acetyltransferase
MEKKKLIIRQLQKSDIEEVLELERENFPLPWSRNMFESELHRDNGLFLVAREDGVLLGYLGLIFILEEGHITNLCVRKDRRREGIASRLLLSGIEHSLARGIRFLTLEVRRFNQAALKLYEKFGFSVIGERKRYYIDNGEDALIMWTDDLQTPAYRGLLQRLEEEMGSWGMEAC